MKGKQFNGKLIFEFPVKWLINQLSGQSTATSQSIGMQSGYIHILVCTQPQSYSDMQTQQGR